MKDLINLKNERKSSRDAGVADEDNSVSNVFFIIFCCFVAALVLVIQNIRYIGQENKIRALITQKRNIEMEIAPYIIEENNIVKLREIEKHARNKLNMRFPDEKKIKKIIVGPPE